MQRLMNGRRRLVAIAIYAAVTTFSYALSYAFVSDFHWSRVNTALLLGTLPALVIIRAACALSFKLSRTRWRFVGVPDFLRLNGALTLGSLLFYTATHLAGLVTPVPRAIILMEWVISFNLTSALWVGYRLLYERLRVVGDRHPRRRTIIIGAGEAGNLLVREMIRTRAVYRPVAFLDDDVTKWGTHVQGIEVMGNVSNLAAAAKRLGAEEIAIAMPTATPEQLRHVVAACDDVGLPFKVLPGISEVLNGQVTPMQLRDVRIEDLLGRDPVDLDLPELAADIQGRAVLITGAAGSIGSELSRQVARHEPDVLILLDQAETALFYLELELQQAHPDVRVVCVIADVVNQPAVRRVFEQYRPERIFHAAAYKHVPMMETNPLEAVRNNVIGTWRVASLAAQFEAEKFVLVSTDKAVAPTSIMGATKRLAELITLELQEEYPTTTFCAVRFGNVLGSSGSVIPVFKRQLEEGRPLTVTHPEVTRYFMTIPEAVQLILQSSLLSEVKGRIAMLDMGQPVPIVALAENLLRLSGSYGDLKEQIVFTGLRPGEKLHEELHSAEEITMPTGIPKVRLISATSTNGSVTTRVRSWESQIENEDTNGVLRSVADMFPLLRIGGRGSMTTVKAAAPILRVEA